MYGIARVVVSILVLFVVACSDERPPDTEPIDTSDTESAGFIELEIGDHADFAALAAQELAFRGPVSDETGASYISIFTTPAHAASLEPFGFKPVGYAGTPRSRTTSAFGPECPATGNCTSPMGAPYFVGYDDIIDELADMASVATAVTLVEVGTSYDGRPIMGVQFGPSEAHEPGYAPETIYVLATYHAREWLTTAVAMQLARWLYEVIISGTVDGVLDTGLGLSLAHAAVVIVPVVNPDGYEYTRTPGGRGWRSNRNLSNCVHGVDLNRNHSIAHDALPMPLPCNATQVYPGPNEASEIETQAIENLLTGNGFPEPQQPVATISYHAYADMVIYPDGYKEMTTPEGPACALGADNCFNADFTLLRNLFGDTHSSLFVDDVSYLPLTLEFPYYRDHSSTVLYAVVGDVGLQATYGPSPMLAITPELPSNCYEFMIECSPHADTVVLQTAADQLNVIRRVLSVATTLDSTSAVSNYGPNAVGSKASGLWTREYRDGNSTSARATFVKSVFLPDSTGALTANIDGEEYDYRRGRKGAQYELYYLPLASEPELDELCLPCEIISIDGGEPGTDGTTENCPGCIDLCDPDRLDAAGWEIRSGTRGGAPDCWWTPSEDDGVLEVPSFTPPADTTHCHLTFSVIWGVLSANQVWIERERTGGGWETLMTAEYGDPYNHGFFEDERMLSYAFEGNNFLGTPRTPKFRFRVDGNAPTDTLQLFDPVVYCRHGELP